MSEVIVKEQLKQIIDKVRRLEQEKADLSADIKGIFDEAKSNGFDTKIIRQILRLMKLDKNKLAEQEAMLDLYRGALDF